MFRVNCSNPLIIVNPSLRHQIRYAVKYSFLGKIGYLSTDLRNRIILGENACRVFNVYQPMKFSADPVKRFEYAEQFFFLSEFGEIIDFFSEIKCGKCEICRNDYITTLKQRVMFQIQEVPQLPLFVTLTYDPDKQPPLGPDVRLIQLFKKRLKMVLERQFHYDGALVKFVVTSEYGKGDNLHYHMLVLGLPRLASNVADNIYTRYHLFEYCFRQPEYEGSDLNPISFDRYCKKYPQVFKRPKGYDPFSYGYVSVKEIDNSSKAVNYVTKYITKDAKQSGVSPHLLLGFDPVYMPSWYHGFKEKGKYYYVPKLDAKGRRRHFLLISQHMGLKFASSLVVRPDGCVQFTNWMDNTLHVVHLTSYYINKLFPSFSKLVPSNVRRSFDFACVCIARLLTSNYCSRDLRKMILNTSCYLKSNFPYICDDLKDEDAKSEFPTPYEFDCCLRDLADCASTLYAWIVETDFDALHRCLLARDSYMCKLKSEIPRDALPLISKRLKDDLIKTQCSSKI